MIRCDDKVIYTKKEAQTKLKYLIDSGRWNKKDLGRIYPCKSCSGWHITSKQNKPKVDMRGVEIKFKKKWKQILKNQNK